MFCTKPVDISICLAGVVIHSEKRHKHHYVFIGKFRSGCDCEFISIWFFIAERDECIPNPCKSAGKCFPADNRIGYHCVCVEGKRGLQCERKCSVKLGDDVIMLISWVSKLNMMNMKKIHV